MASEKQKFISQKISKKPVGKGNPRRSVPQKQAVAIARQGKMM